MVQEQVKQKSTQSNLSDATTMQQAQQSEHMQKPKEEIEYNYANFGERFLAVLIDGVLL